MKKTFAIALILFTINNKSICQAYNTEIGLGVDFGDGATLVGPTIKHFFSETSALQGQLLFGTGITAIGGYYQYHGGLGSARNLTWYFGGGPAIAFGKTSSALWLRPMAGLDYKIKDAPVAFNFDWRPLLALAKGGSSFTPARFGINFNYTFK